jgi:hypothetical protein
MLTRMIRMPFKLLFSSPIKLVAAIPVVVFGMGYLRDQPVILPIDVPPAIE